MKKNVVVGNLYSQLPMELVEAQEHISKAFDLISEYIKSQYRCEPDQVPEEYAEHELVKRLDDVTDQIMYIVGRDILYNLDRRQ